MTAPPSSSNVTSSPGVAVAFDGVTASRFLMYIRDALQVAAAVEAALPLGLCWKPSRRAAVVVGLVSAT